jgi:hypothetical protein
MLAVFQLPTIPCTRPDLLSSVSVRIIAEMKAFGELCSTKQQLYNNLTNKQGEEKRNFSIKMEIALLHVSRLLQKGEWLEQQKTKEVYK